MRSVILAVSVLVGLVSISPARAVPVRSFVVIDAEHRAQEEERERHRWYRERWHEHRPDRWHEHHHEYYREYR
jgi:hypothetical protein